VGTSLAASLAYGPGAGRCRHLAAGTGGADRESPYGRAAPAGTVPTEAVPSRVSVSRARRARISAPSAALALPCPRRLNVWRSMNWMRQTSFKSAVCWNDRSISSPPTTRSRYCARPGASSGPPWALVGTIDAALLTRRWLTPQFLLRRLPKSMKSTRNWKACRRPAGRAWLSSGSAARRHPKQKAAPRMEGGLSINQQSAVAYATRRQAAPSRCRPTSACAARWPCRAARRLGAEAPAASWDPSRGWPEGGAGGSCRRWPPCSRS